MAEAEAGESQPGDYEALHHSLYPETSVVGAAKESITKSHVTRDLSPRKVFDSYPVDSMASLPKLFQQKGGLESLRPHLLMEMMKEDSAEDASGHRPRVLQRLEAILEEKLKSARQTIALLGPEEPGYSTSFLECSAYRHVFDAFIQSFTTYRPLLLKIKREYDHAFEDALKAAHENVRMRADLAVAEKEREHKVAEGRRAVQESTVRQKKAMQSRIKDLKSQIELSSAMAKEAEAEAHALRLQVKGARKEIRDMRSQSRQIQRQLMNDSAWQGLGSGSAALASVDSVPSDI